ncbi:MAG: nitroreductase family deazaflavin-dependent oxidoreductase [Candidatus Dormiibacterota bacterium]
MPESDKGEKRTKGTTAGTRGATAFYLNPTGFKIQRALHIPIYRLTGGLIGHRIGPAKHLILTVTGAKSGQPRTTALTYERDGDNLVVVASKGGVADHPHWYKNMLVNPEVEVQVKSHKGRFRARTAVGEERRRLWKIMTRVYSGYDDYQRATDREIPVVVLEPAG